MESCDLDLAQQEKMENKHIYILPDGTSVSTVDRACPEASQIAVKIPADDQVFNSDGRPNCAFIKEHLKAEGKLSIEQMIKLLNDGIRVLKSEANLLITDAPIIICGDIHGQYFDLMKLFEVAGGEPPNNKFLFLGDYVDRGYFSIECFLYLLCLKICYPEKLFMLRGNHECRHLTKHFTFRLECGYKYNNEIYETCMEAFDALPLAALVNKQFFCVHGGLSPQLKCPRDVNEINRFQEPPKSGLMCDLLWSDPAEDYGIEKSKEMFIMNTARGCSYRYSYYGACDFLTRNNLLAIVRGHEAQDAGYRLYRNAEKSEFPTLMTLFSAPNYVDVYKNKAAILKYDGEVLNIRQFNHSPHPFYLPKFMSVFDWSLPFVGEKIADLLLAVLNIPNMQAELQSLSDDQREAMSKENERRQKVIKGKIKAIGKVNKMFSTVRNEREALTELMNALGTKIIPSHYLTLSGEDLKKVIKTFEEARECDIVNEKLPDYDEVDDAASVSSIATADNIGTAAEDRNNMEIS